MQRREVISGMAATAAAAVMPGAALAGVVFPEPERSYPYVIIAPDLYGRSDEASETIHGNFRTVHWKYMARWTVNGPGIENTTLELTKVGTDTYRRWLEEDTTPRKHPPHISFGGCVTPLPRGVPGDPTFYPRWLEHAKTLA